MKSSVQEENALEPLHADETFRARLIEGSQDCIKVLDLEGRLLSMNAGGMKVLEICDLAPFIGANWVDFWKDKDRAAAIAAVKKAREGEVGRFVGFFPTTQTGKPMWFDVVVSPINDANGRPEKLLASSRDVTEWKRTEDLLRAIIEGTAEVTGESFFRSLVRHLAEGLRVRWVFVAECLPDLRARSLAYWVDGGLGENFEYDLRGTPCLEVAQGRTCHVPDRLPEVFPEDKGMIEMGTVSYLGVPLRDSAGRIIGHLVAFDDKPMPRDALALSVLETFANRAGAELERERSYRDLKHLNLELRAMLDVNRAIGRHLQRDELFGALARCLQTIVKTDHFGIEMAVDGDKLQAHILGPLRTAPDRTRSQVLPAEGTACRWVEQNRVPYIVSSRAELRERFPVTFGVMEREGMESLCALPLVTGEHCRGVLFFMAAEQGAYQQTRQSLFDQLTSAVAVALDDCLAHEEVRRLRDRLAAENAYLQEEIRSEHNFDEIVGNSAALLEVLRCIDQVASADSTVLILGETGTGKELIARAIHDRSPRKNHPLVKVNCGAISAGLVESELFGHVKGAFTGALTGRDGRFKLADGGTIFLDEVGELPMETQVKLLRVLQEQEFEPIGSSKTVKVDVRVIAATNRDLADAIREGKFRNDLFYRLNVVPVRVPSLRERAGDVPLLTTFFLQRFGKRFNKPVKQISEEAIGRLCGYHWPGNIRELQNVIERAVVLTTGSVLTLGPDFHPQGGGRMSTAADSASAPRPARAAPVQEKTGAGSLEDVERRHIESVLTQTNWMIEGERGAARILNLNPSTLRSRMQKLAIKRPGRPG